MATSRASSWARKALKVPRLQDRLPQCGSGISTTCLRARSQPCRRASSTTTTGGSRGAPRSRPLPYKPPPPAPPKASQPMYTPPPSGRQPLPELVRTRWIALFGMGAAALCIGSFTASFLYQSTTSSSSGSDPHHSKATTSTYVTGAEPGIPTGRPTIQSPLEFDLHLDKSEWRFGITKLRRRLAARARGHVLEVAVGAGRNLEFYDWDGIAAQLAAEEAVPAGAGDSQERERRKQQLEKRVEKSTPWWPRRDRGDAEEEGMRSFTGVDVDAGMLDVGLRRVRQVVPGAADELGPKPSWAQEMVARRSASSGPEGKKEVDGEMESLNLLSSRLRLFRADAAETTPLPPPPQTSSPSSSSSPPPRHYDTIVQTFGLCSVRDPARLLANMAAAIAPGTGRILLLEHGRSLWDVVNALLDRSAAAHFDRFGCWWNRDIELVVERARAAVPGLEVVEIARPGWMTLGTHVWVELRVRDVPAAAAAAHAVVASGGGGGGGSDAANNGEDKAGGGGWMSWMTSFGLSAPKPTGGEKKD